MQSTRQPRIVIADLPALELLTADELARVLGAGKANRVRLGVERLEGRELMAAAISASFSDGVLTVYGTTGNDQILLGQDNGTIQVKTWQTTAGPTTTREVGGLVISDSSISAKKVAIDIWKYTHTESYSNGVGSTSDTAAKVKGVRASEVKEIRVIGGDGHDTIRLDDGAQAITAKAFLYGGAGNDLLVGGAGNDELSGWTGNDRLYGGRGDDTLWGQGDNDLLSGQEGRDTLYGNYGQDTLYGTVGEDKVIDGGQDNDRLYLTFNLDTFFTYKGHDSVVDSASWGGTDTVSVWMDLGTKGKQLVSTFIDQARQLAGQLQPVVDLLNTRLPLPGGGSSASLGDLLGGNYKAVANVISAVNGFSTSSFKAGEFYLGTFQVSSSGISQKEAGSLASKAFAGELRKLGGAFDVSFLTNATQALKVALGHSADLFRFDLGKFRITGKELNQHLGSFMVGPVPVKLTLKGSLQLEAGGSLAYDLTGIRENNLIRGLRLDNVSVTLKAPVAVEAHAGISSMKVGGYSIGGIGVGGGGEVTGTVTVSANGRLASGGSVSRMVSVSGGLHYRLYLYAEYPNGVSVSLKGMSVSWGRDETTVFSGRL